MKVSKVSYRCLRKTAEFENDTIEVVVDVGPKDSVGVAIKKARATCLKALRRTKARSIIENDDDCFLDDDFAY